MKVGRFLISVGLLILILSQITFPISSTVYVNSTFTMPPWYSHATIKVINGTFLIQKGYQYILLRNGSSINLNGEFKMYGNGNASIILSDFKIIDNFEYNVIMLIIIILGIIIEILQVIKGKNRKI